MKASLIALSLTISAGLAGAETCPQAADHSVAIARLVEAIRVAPDARAAREISNDMWALWTDAPDEKAQMLLDRGMTRRAELDLVGALQDFKALVDYCPNYDEGYNQRAFVNFIRKDYASALVDLDRVLEVSPAHLGALSGRALTLIALGRDREAQQDLRMAVILNPWLPERVLLQPERSNADDPDL